MKSRMTEKPRDTERKGDTERKRERSLEELISIYLDILKNDTTKSKPEFEARFGGFGKTFTKIDYDNVIKKLYSLGFKTMNTEGYDLLRIYTYDQINDKYSNQIRVEIDDFSVIQQYCKHENIEDIRINHSHNIQFNKKSQPRDKDNRKIDPVILPDFILKYALSIEEKLYKQSDQVNLLIENMKKSNKMYRYLNRLSFYHPDLPIQVDMSIVKMSSKSFSMSQSNLFSNPETYEIELEIVNNKINSSTTDVELIKDLKKVVKYILMGIQGTNYPISYKEQKEVIENYQKMIQFKNDPDYLKEDQRDLPLLQQFIGPSSKTLQMENIIELTDVPRNDPNIRKDYIVTDKADGERLMLFVSNNHKIYFINTSMNVIFTGLVTSEDRMLNTLLDGEFIVKDKKGDSIQLYAAFDIYFIENRDIRELPLYSEDERKPSRLIYMERYLNEFTKNISYINQTKGKFIKNGLQFTKKNFYEMDPTITEPIEDQYKIFTACKFILESTYIYNTDGIIFTPKYYGVGSIYKDRAGPKRKKTWEYSFKWKPSSFNTIDFLVKTKKNKTNTDLILNLYQDGMNTVNISSQITEYKVLYLFIGTNQIYDAPCETLYKGDFLDGVVDKYGKPQNYIPAVFKPTCPPDNEAGICNLLLKNGQLKTEEDEVFTDNMIVEFKYDKDAESRWRWKPLRVRYDKTTRYKRGDREYGNSFEVADSNWRSIFMPITTEIITTGANIPPISEIEDKYYNRSNNITYTTSLREFHNLYVKKKIITSVSKPGNKLIDYACGKAGDLSKWMESKLSFVFGIDLYADNLNNKSNGACYRFLESKKKNSNIPDALFVQGDSTKNIKNGDALFTETDKLITNSVFGVGSKQESKNVGKYVEQLYGIAKHGFQVSSCQFAIHYFFETVDTCDNFLKNISECTQKDGYFIGTCYDGKKIFDLLKDKTSFRINKDEHTIWEIKKQYTNTEFRDDASSFGYGIEVYQESINMRFTEYLVNFEYLIRLMKVYGFELLTEEESQRIGLPHSAGSFKLLFKQMIEDMTKDRKDKLLYNVASQMTDQEKTISFYNNYFVFKKVRNITTEHVVIEREEYKEVQSRKTHDIPTIKSKTGIPSSGIIKTFKNKIVLENEIEKVEISEIEIPEVPSVKKKQVKIKDTVEEFQVSPEKISSKIKPTLQPRSKSPKKTEEIIIPSEEIIIPTEKVKTKKPSLQLEETSRTKSPKKSRPTLQVEETIIPTEKVRTKSPKKSRPTLQLEETIIPSEEIIIPTEKVKTKKPSLQSEETKRTKSPTKKPTLQIEEIIIPSEPSRTKSPTKRPTLQIEETKRTKSPTKKPSLQIEEIIIPSEKVRSKTPTKRLEEPSRSKTPTKRPTLQVEESIIKSKSSTKKTRPTLQPDPVEEESIKSSEKKTKTKKSKSSEEKT